MSNRIHQHRFARGFSLISAIFLLVVLSALGTYMVIFTGQQQTTVQADVLGVRAYYAARAGLDWGTYLALDPENTAGAPPAFAACPAGTINTMGGSLSPFTVVVTCNDTGFSYDEAGRAIHVYEITATACNNASCPAASPPAGYVERRIVVILAKCKDPTAAAPRYECGY
jgi:MSHA biogenesis protein MshP